MRFFLRILKRHRLPQNYARLNLPVSLQAGINFREADSGGLFGGFCSLPFSPRTFGSPFFFIFFYSIAVSFNCSAFDAVDTYKLTRSATDVAPLLFLSPLPVAGSSRPADCQSFPRKFSRLGNQPDLSKYQRVAFNLGSNNK